MSKLRALPLAVLMLLAQQALAQAPQQPSGAEAEIRALLAKFLANAGDRATHERFWADDLMYTGSSGRFVTKADILKSMSEPKKDPAEPESRYRGEDVQVRVHGNVALVTFRLVQQTEKDGSWKDTAHYRNSATFMRRNGEWRAVLWQATKLETAIATESKEGKN
jgi:ketosteroid isomerase-like protein